MNRVPAALGLTPEQVETVLATAGRAPSPHNTQPWRFRVRRHAIELHLDPERALPVVDPEGTEQRLACGAALFNLRLALHSYGIRPLVTFLPDRGNPNYLAVVRHGGHKPATPEQKRLLRAVPARRTNRRPFSDQPVPASDRHALRRAALDEGVWLHVVENPAEREAVRRIVARAQARQLADPAFREELRRWVGGPPGRRDGIPYSALGPMPESVDVWVRHFGTAVGHDPPPAEVMTGTDGKTFEAEPMIAMLIPHLFGPDADVQAGQALQRVLLTATANGLATSFLSQAVEVPETREDLRRLLGSTRSPVAVLRIGYGWPVPATPRREVADLLLPSADVVT